MLAILLIDLTLSPLVESLSHPRFRAREAIHARLARLGALPIPVLLRGQNHADPEIARRCVLLLAPHEEQLTWAAAGRIFPHGWTHHPWVYVGGWYSAESESWRRCAEARGIRAGGDSDGWSGWRYACRLWIQGQLRQGRPVVAIRADLEVMADAERAWWLPHVPSLPLLARVPLP